MDFRKLFGDVRQRRRMFVLDDRYMTIVAFVDGCDAATGWRLLNGFGEWVAHRVIGKSSPLAWAVQIAEKHGVQLKDDVSSERVEDAIADLFSLLDEFLSERAGALDVIIE